MNTIISKRLSTFTYQQWTMNNGQYIPVGKGVIINGGAGVVGGSDLLSGRPLEKRSTSIPVGVLTFVNDETLDYLMGCWKFQKDISKGLIVVVKGKRLDVSEGENIAQKDMVPEENIMSRPYSEKDIEAAGGKINSDGSVDITNAVEDIDIVRRQNAGQPFYVKERNKEEAKKKTRRSSKRK